ncbi:MAG TPA: beta-propeller fold lactonase family protein [Methylomirabilota bacterium]|nr:beta-propeller fold lactonase family protein [Methylomirabilota bacterium]
MNKLVGCACFFLVACASMSLRAQAFMNFEGKQTAPVRLSPDGSRLFAVNTPDNRLSVFDVSNPLNPILIAEIPVGLEPVSVNPRNSDEAWVVNEVSDSVSIVSVSQRTVTDTLYVKDEPADVVFANGRAFVSAARNNQIAVFDVLTHASVTNIPVFGENPRSLCVNSNGTRIYAAFALSGNRTTLIPFTEAPPPPPPTNPSLPPPPLVSLIVDATDPAWTSGPNAQIKFTMPDNDIVEIDTATLAITRYFPRVGTVNFAIAARPGNGDLYVANTDARNLTRFEPVLRGGFVTNQVSRVNITSGAVTRFDLNTNFAYANFPNLGNQSNALAQPTAIAFGQSGNNYFVAAFGSDRVAMVDANNGNVIFRIEINPDALGSIANPRTKRGPRGLALKPGAALYVANRISNTLTVVDPVARAVVREIPLGTYDPTPAVIREGRGFLYDAKLSGGGLVSCASCHIDSEMDMLAWDLGDPGGSLETNRMRVSGSQTVIPGGLFSNVVFHPMKGPMTTQTLRGLNGLDPLHWRGDRTNFLHFNGAFDGLLGGPMLSAADMEAYRAYINTIVYQPNPNQNLDRTLPASFGGGNPILGRNAYMRTNYGTLGFIGLNCNTCHALPNGTDRGFTPAIALQEPQDFKVPQLRATYQKMRFTNAPGAPSLLGFGLVHDGSDPSLFAFLSRSVFGPLATDPAQKRNISAFVQCLDTGLAPAVGYARTVTSNNMTSTSINNDWSMLEAQTVGGTNIDLIVKGMVDGQRRGFVYVTASNNYRPDKQSLPPLTKAQLVAKVQNGSVITLMGVPPGAGTRIGINHNSDALLDGDTPPPSLHLVRSATNSVVAWPTNASGFVLETSATIPAANWSAETSIRGTAGSEFRITNAPTQSSRFFRLREL